MACPTTISRRDDWCPGNVRCIQYSLIHSNRDLNYSQLSAKTRKRPTAFDPTIVVVSLHLVASRCMCVCLVWCRISRSNWDTYSRLCYFLSSIHRIFARSLSWCIAIVSHTISARLKRIYILMFVTDSRERDTRCEDCEMRDVSADTWKNVTFISKRDTHVMRQP